jgi:hypothetical protein
MLLVVSIANLYDALFFSHAEPQATYTRLVGF